MFAAIAQMVANIFLYGFCTAQDFNCYGMKTFVAGTKKNNNSRYPTNDILQTVNL
jgi:hypothetical protein